MSRIRPLAAVRVRSHEQFLAMAAAEVREHMAVLGAAGWSLWDIAAALDCGRTALWSWRTGASDMPGSKLLALRALASEIKRAS
jgi:hypothetical protein